MTIIGLERSSYAAALAAIAALLLAAEVAAAQPPSSFLNDLVTRSDAGAVTLIRQRRLRTPPAAFAGLVTAVKDGDTIAVLHQGRETTIRLAGIDCPEKRQPFGNRAKQMTSALVFGREVRVQPTERDRYGRMVAKVYLPNGESLNAQLVRQGMAWWYRKFSTDIALQTFELEARTARRGLWSDPAPLAPWEYRASRRAKPRL
ncbi:MAG TPA: thermonuclease family protein [Terriglobales bacterium]|nr:thermonuclease family protein [Terriglobales bacterium]